MPKVDILKYKKNIIIYIYVSFLVFRHIKKNLAVLAMLPYKGLIKCFQFNNLLTKPSLFYYLPMVLCNLVSTIILIIIIAGILIEEVCLFGNITFTIYMIIKFSSCRLTLIRIEEVCMFGNIFRIEKMKENI